MDVLSQGCSLCFVERCCQQMNVNLQQLRFTGRWCQQMNMNLQWFHFCGSSAQMVVEWWVFR